MRFRHAFFTVNYSRRRFIQMGVLLGLLVRFAPVEAGGGDLPSRDPAAALLADDSLFQRLRRFFSPRSYWTEKVKGLEGEVASLHREAMTSHEQFRQALLQRREALRLARAKAEEEKRDPTLARQEVMRSFRANIDLLRRESHAKNQRYRQQLLWIAQARQALDKAIQ